MNRKLISKLKEYHRVQSTLCQQLEKLETLKNNTELIRELEFEKKLMTLLKRHSKTLEDLLVFIRLPTFDTQPAGRMVKPRQVGAGRNHPYTPSV
jgi:hypothetical protein